MCSAIRSRWSISRKRPPNYPSSRRLTIERYALPRPDFPIAPEAETYPFIYSADDRSDLGRLLERHYPDPRGVVEEWARHFILETPANTFNLLATMNAAIRGSFEYRAREEEGTQAPVETIEMKSGTCRDYALLFIEAARALGFGARFVSGYLYDPALDGGEGLQGAGATHAWAEVYLPGAGWVEFDPTNCARRGREPDPHRGDARSRAGDPDRRKLFRRARIISAWTVDVTVHAETAPPTLAPQSTRHRFLRRGTQLADFVIFLRRGGVSIKRTAAIAIETLT